MEHAKLAKELCHYNSIYTRASASVAVAAWE